MARVGDTMVGGGCDEQANGKTHIRTMRGSWTLVWVGFKTTLYHGRAVVTKFIVIRFIIACALNTCMNVLIASDVYDYGMICFFSYRSLFLTSIF